MTHSKWFSPSASSGWLNCAAHASHSGSSSHSRLGTAAHELAEQILTAWKRNEKDFNFIGHTIPVEQEMFTVTPEMLENVERYTFQVQAACGFDPINLEVEQRVRFDKVLNLKEEAWGTADAIIVDPETNGIEIHDLKYGTGVKVEAVGNTQMLMYAVGAVGQLLWESPDELPIKLVIHQPRINHYDEWQIDVRYLREWVESIKSALSNRIAVSQGADLQKYETTGDAQCRWCARKADCKTLEREVLDCFEDTSDDDESLVRNYKKLDLIDAWCKAIKAKAYQLAEANRLPGYKLVEGRKGNAKWIDEKEAEVALMGLDVEPFEYKLKTPSAVKRSLSKTDAKLVDQMTKRSDGRPTIAPESDKRPAISLTDDFDDIS